MRLFYHFRRLRIWPIQKTTENRSTQTERIEIGTAGNGVSKLATDNTPTERSQSSIIPTVDPLRMHLLARNNPTAVYNYREIALSRLPPPDRMDVENQLIYRALLKFFTEEEKKRTYFHYYNVRTELLKKEQFGIDYKSLHSLIEGNIKWIGDTLQVYTVYGEWKMTRSQIERGRGSHTQHYGFECEWNNNFFARMKKAILAHECIDCICTASWLCDATTLIKSLGTGTTRFIASCHHKIILDGDDLAAPDGEKKEPGKKSAAADGVKKERRQKRRVEQKPEDSSPTVIPAFNILPPRMWEETGPRY